MQARCGNPRDVQFHNYGGRGVTVCDRWQRSFADFLADVGQPPSEHHQLDRFPRQSGNYEPGNVRWATAIQQANNKRNNVILRLGDVARTLMEWSRATGLSESCLRGRVSRGWGSERTLTQPSRRTS